MDVSSEDGPTTGGSNADGALGGHVESVGTYVPRSRVDLATIDEAWDGVHVRGVEKKRVPAADEDSVTMAVAAAREALAGAPLDRDAVGTLALGTTTPPVDEGEVGATLAEILGLDRGVAVTTHTQSTRGGVRALVDGVRAGDTALVVAADCPRGAPGDAHEHAAGAGAVAFVVADGDGDHADAPVVTDHATYTEEFAGTRFRRRGEQVVEGYGATTYEREAYTTVVSGAVDGLAFDPAAVAPSAPNGGLPGRAGRAIGDVDVHHMATDLGDTGAASPLFGLVSAWDAGVESVAVVGYGDGASADAVAVEGRLPVETDRPAASLTFAEYARKRGHLGGGD